MIALDTSAVVAIAMEEPEGKHFDTLIAENRTTIGTPTLFEARMVLGALMPTFVEDFQEVLILRRTVQPVAFTLQMYRMASDAFQRFGKGQGHPARLNFGDCQSYAVSKAHDAPLLFKGGDFIHTDIEPAYKPIP